MSNKWSVLYFFVSIHNIIFYVKNYATFNIFNVDLNEYVVWIDVKLLRHMSNRNYYFS